MDKVTLTKELLVFINQPRVDRYNRLSTRFKYRLFHRRCASGFIGHPCQGCKGELVVGDVVFVFRYDNYVHAIPKCVRCISRFRLTIELKKWLALQ